MINCFIQLVRVGISTDFSSEHVQRSEELRVHSNLRLY